MTIVFISKFTMIHITSHFSNIASDLGNKEKVEVEDLY